MIIRIILIITSIVCVNEVLGQYSVSTYLSPVNIRLGDVNSSRITKSNEHVDINYKNKITSEFGINIEKRKSGKHYLGVGISWKNYDYSYKLTVKKDFLLDGVLTKDRTIEVEAIGIRIITGHSLSKNTNVRFLIEVNFPYKYYSNIEHKENYTLYIAREVPSGIILSNITIREREYTDATKFYNYIVPEFNFETEILKNISVYYGLKLKVWSLYNLYDVSVWGDYNGNNYEKLFQSTVDTKRIIFNFGLQYRLIPKNNKNKSS